MKKLPLEYQIVTKTYLKPTYLLYGMQVGISQSGLRTRHAQTRYYIGTGQAFRHPNFQRSIFSRPDALLWMVAHGWRNSSFGYGPGMTFTTKSFKSYLYMHSYIYSVQLAIDSCKLSQKFPMAKRSILIAS